MNRNCFVKLLIYSPEISSEEISRKLNLNGNVKKVYGEKIIDNKTGNVFLIKDPWILTTENIFPTRKICFGPHLEFILLALKGIKKSFISLQKQQIKIELHLVYFTEVNGLGGPTLTQKQQSEIAEFNLDIIFDVLFLHNDERISNNRALNTDVNNYDTCYESFIELRVIGENLNPNDISKKLRLTPTKYAETGEIRISKRGIAMPPVKKGFWEISTSKLIDSNDLGDHLNWLIAHLIDVKKEYEKLQSEGLEFSLTCLWESKRGYGGPCLSNNQMQLLKKTNLNCDFLFHFFID